MKNRFTLLIAFCLMTISMFSQTVDVVSGLSFPYGLAIHGNELYISENNSNEISKIDINDPNPVVTAVLNVSTPGGLLINGNDLYHTNLNNGIIYKVDLTQSPLSPQTVVDLNTNAAGLAIINDELYISTESGGGIVKLDLNQPNPTATTIVSGMSIPFGLVTDGNNLFVSEFGAGRISKIDLSQPTPVPTTVITGLLNPGGLTLNGNFLYIADGGSFGGRISRIDVTQSTPTLELIVDGLNNPRLVAFDGIDMYIAEAGAGKISKLEIGQPIFSTLGIICTNAVPANLGGASPTGGTYSGPGVTDDGNGETFTFDPNAAGGVGSYTITYTAINGLTATSTLTVVAPPTVTFTPPASVTLNAGVQTLNGMPAGGTYSGPGVTGDSFDPAAAGVGTHTITYNYTDGNGCSGMASGEVTVVSPVSGDDCADANDLQSLFGQPYNEPQTSGLWDNTDATTNGDPAAGWDCFGEPDGLGGGPSLERTIWYSFTGDGNTYKITTVPCNATNYIGDGDTQMAIYSGDCANPVPLACNEDEQGASDFRSSIELATEAGVTYLIMIDGFGPDFERMGEYCVEVINLTEPPSLDGNECADANDINDLFGQPINEPQVSSLWDNSNYSSISDPADGNTCHLNMDPLDRTIWYSFTSPDGSTYGIRTIECNATNYIFLGDTEMTIYEGDDCGNLTQVACNEDEDVPNSFFNAYVELPTNAGTTYHILVDGHTFSSGEFCLEVTNLAPNSITDTRKTDISIYPNPTTGMLQLKNVEADQVQVFDNLGRLVFSQERPGSGIDISEMAAGLYFLKITEGEEVYSARVVKE